MSPGGSCLGNMPACLPGPPGDMPAPSPPNNTTPTPRAPAVGGDSYVNIEYECSAAFDLQRVQVRLSLGVARGSGLRRLRAPALHRTTAHCAALHRLSLPATRHTAPVASAAAPLSCTHAAPPPPTPPHPTPPHPTVCSPAQIVIPLPALHQAPQVNSIDGDWRYDARKSGEHMGVGVGGWWHVVCVGGVRWVGGVM